MSMRGKYQYYTVGVESTPVFYVGTQVRGNVIITPREDEACLFQGPDAGYEKAWSAVSELLKTFPGLPWVIIPGPSVEGLGPKVAA